MTKRAQAVIGAAYGDEGKGLLVDVLASRLADPVAVRTASGAQAGHTVTTPEGDRHVFHHIGSAALANGKTHLSQFMAVHPMLFLDEHKMVADLGGRLDITCDPRAKVTTPFDILINQAVENARGDGRHGSCGVGFGETIERNLRREFAITAQDLHRYDLRDRLMRIREAWVPARLAALGIALGETDREILADDRILDNFLLDCAALLENIAFHHDRNVLGLGDIIFEGAQGLLLDQDYGAFPHVTRSNTGLRNMLHIAGEAGIEQIEATYVTRAYTTRHGAGPLPFERPKLTAFDVVDPTNQPNEWQGSLRFADLNVETISAAIDYDLELADITDIAVSAGVAVTCLDQAKAPVPIVIGGRRVEIGADIAAPQIAEQLGLPLAGESWGPTRNTFEMARPGRQNATRAA